MRMAPDCHLPDKKNPRCMWLKRAQVGNTEMLFNCICLDINFTVDCYIKVKNYSRL